MLTGLSMIEKLLQTDADYVCTFLRTIAGIIIFPYGMQKLLGWFDGVGIDARVIKWLWSNAIKTKFRGGARSFED